MDLLYPRIPKEQWNPLWRSAFAGFLFAVVFGVVHDLITFGIGPEYFTAFKFDQFAWADFGQSPVVFAAMIGAIASGVMGLFVAWFLARVALPRHSFAEARRRIRFGLVATFLLAILGAVGGYGYGLLRGPEADYSFWSATVDPLRIENEYAFIRVAYIHNGTYLGATAGFVVGMIRTRRKTHEKQGVQRL